MPNGLSGRNLVIAILIAIVVGVIGTAIGYQIGAVWLGYAGTAAAALYLITVYMKAEEPTDTKGSGPTGGKRHDR